MEADFFQSVAGTLEVRKLYHQTDPATSALAAQQIADSIGPIQARVLAVLKAHGPLTDEQLVQLLASEYGPSTVRTRRHELVEKGKVVADGETMNAKGRRVTVWKAAL